MKYLVTRDGEIYDLKSKEVSSIEQKDDYINVFYYDRDKGQYLERDNNGGSSMDCIYESEIIKVADTIEELCEKFVVIDKETEEVMNIVAFWEYAKHWVSWKYTICGAIWIKTKLPNGRTICTLKPIAYVNDDGVLELI